MAIRVSMMARTSRQGPRELQTSLGLVPPGWLKELDSLAGYKSLDSLPALTILADFFVFNGDSLLRF